VKWGRVLKQKDPGERLRSRRSYRPRHKRGEQVDRQLLITRRWFVCVTLLPLETWGSSPSCDGCPFYGNLSVILGLSHAIYLYSIEIERHLHMRRVYHATPVVMRVSIKKIGRMFNKRKRYRLSTMIPRTLHSFMLDIKSATSVYIKPRASEDDPVTESCPK
jgi:hypothetical protein